MRGKLPVNVIFVAEGDEERMDIGLRNFVRDHQDLFKGADTMFGPGRFRRLRVYPADHQRHGLGTRADGFGYPRRNKRSVDSPAWRHVKMLASLVSDDGNTPLIKGWKENWVPPTKEALDRLRKRAAGRDIPTMAANLGVARYIADNPFDVLRMQSYGNVFQSRRHLGRQYVRQCCRRHSAE